jgi:hypothetical protein
MSDCCLPNLGCLAIPILSTNVNGPAGQNGLPGRGITSTFYNNANGTLTIFYSDGTSQNVGVVQGPIGSSGPPGVDGMSRLFTTIFQGNTSSAVINTWEQMDTYTLPVGELVNIGDAVVINYEVELLLNNANVFGVRLIPLRRISIGTGTSLTKYDSTNVLAEPQMNTKSAVTATMSFSYNVKLELIKVSASNTTANFLRKCTFDSTIPSTPNSFTNGSGSLLNINVNNPVVFSFDIYQYQSTEIRMKSVTIDKIKAQ